jgi:hypothetical protein
VTGESGEGTDRKRQRRATPVQGSKLKTREPCVAGGSCRGGPHFFGSVHSKENKVLYFYRFTEVFILKGLTGLICIKIVQVL